MKELFLHLQSKIDFQNQIDELLYSEKENKIYIDYNYTEIMFQYNERTLFKLISDFMIENRLFAKIEYILSEDGKSINISL
jgi:hypothetical protein